MDVYRRRAAPAAAGTHRLLPAKPQKRNEHLISVDTGASSADMQRACKRAEEPERAVLDPSALYEGSRNLTFWLTSAGYARDSSAKSTVYMWLRTNLFVITIGWLLFSVAVTAIWLSLHLSGVFVIVPFDGMVYAVTFSFLVFFVTNAFSGASAKRNENGTAFISLRSATNNLMQELRSAVEARSRFWLPNPTVNVLKYTGAKWVSSPMRATDVLEELAWILNAVLAGARNDLRDGLVIEKLPLPDALIAELKYGRGRIDPLLYMQSMFTTRLQLLKEAELLSDSDESILFVRTREITDMLGALEVASKTGAPLVVRINTLLTLVLFTVALPPYFITLFPGYWPLLTVPAVMLFIFTQFELSRKIANIFVSRRRNIWSGFNLLAEVYGGARTNREIAVFIRDMLAELSAPK